MVRGGFGIYYSQIVDNSEADYALTGPTGVFTYTAGPDRMDFPRASLRHRSRLSPRCRCLCAASTFGRVKAQYSNQFFPHIDPDRLSQQTAESLLGTVDDRRRTADRASWILALDYVGTHTLRNQPSAGRRPAYLFHPHRT